MIRSCMLFILLLIVNISSGQTISSGPLNISFDETPNVGVEISSIQNANIELLNIAVVQELFELNILNTTNNNTTSISSSTNWTTINVSLSNGNADATITLSNPAQVDIPISLVVVIEISTIGSKSEWDLSVTGLGNNFSLVESYFPKLNLLGNGGRFLIPRYSGQFIEDPASGINYSGYYPRGNATNMQFMAYYGGGTDIYLGFHDPNAAFKTFLVNDESGGVSVECLNPAPDNTITNNNWQFPGHFEFNLFNGDWYDAALIYKEWASSNANYWPQNTAARQLRQAEIGRIGLWFNDIGYYNMNARTAANIELGTQKCIDYMAGIPIGTHLYTWNGRPNDDDYPEVFPAIVGLDASINTLQNNGAYILPYFNGRLYDTDLASFNGTGLPDAAKDENGDYYSQNFNNSNGVSIHFGVMCPTQITYQNIIRDASVNMTTIMNCKGVYLDQVSAAAGLQCMDNTHNHTLGGGDFWRDGYKTMLSNAHAAMPADRFIAVEGACDYLLDEVDGVLVDPWDKENMVPAYPAVYSGLVQMFGTSTGTGTYNNDSFYAQLAQTFSFGVQPGRFTTYIIDDPNAQATAKPFIKTLGTMRYKLHELMSFGEMKYPISVNPVNPITIPDITSNWGSNFNPRNVTISSLQTSVWQNADSIVVVFVNAAMTGQSLDFTFDFDGVNYGLNGDLAVREVSELNDGTYQVVTNSFNTSLSLSPMDIKAYVIKLETLLPIGLISFEGFKSEQNVSLEWHSSFETNFKEFIIERSNDGQSWTKIGVVSSGLTNSNSYQFLDSSPLKGENYYRLKQVDHDGAYSYSKIVTVEFDFNNIVIFPNPSRGEIFINSENCRVENVKVFDSLGKLVFESIENNNVIDVSYLPKAIYTIIVKTKNETVTMPIILE